MTGHLLSRVRNSQAGLPVFCGREHVSGIREELERANPLQRSSQPTASLFHAPCNLGETDTSFHPIPALGSGYLVFFSFVWPKQKILTEGLCSVL